MRATPEGGKRNLVPLGFSFGSRFAATPAEKWGKVVRAANIKVE
jgi:hypothetical protein